MNSSNSYFTFFIIEDQLKIMVAYDSENIINTYIKIYVKKYTKEKVTISTKFMIDILTTFQNETLFIKKKNNVLNIYSKQGTYEVPILFHKNLINIFSKHISIWNSYSIKFTLFSNILLKILNRTLFAVGDKQFKPILNGVFFKFSPYEANFVATDSFRLVKYTIKSLKLTQYIEFTISKKSLNIIKRILKNEKKSNIIIEYKKINIIFHFKNHIFSCPLINGKYPDYNSMIPNNNNLDFSFIINRLLLLNYIRRISLFSKKKRNFIHFHYYKNKLKIYEQNPIHHNHNYNLKIKYKPIYDDKKKIENIKMGFNSQFLIEILSSINDNLIYFELYHSNKIGILRPFYKGNNKKKESILILIMSTITI